jgi:nucleotide-binding universal stress UspA family protein
VHVEERSDLADDPTWDAMFREGEMRYLESLALAYEGVAGTKVRVALLDPPVAQSLIEFAESRVAPIFIMAGRGRTGIRRALLGSTCDTLIRKGNTPVLVLRDRGPDEPPAWRYGRQPFHRVVLPLDGSTHAEGGIAHAVALASATGARLRLLRVVGPVMSSAVLGGVAMYPAYNEATVIRSDMAETYLQDIVDRIRVSAPKLEVSTEVALSTDPASAIIESCRRMAADLAVIPTHGRGASRMLAAAVGDKLLRDGPDALLFIKPNPSRLPAGLAHPEQKGADKPVPELVR